MSGGLSKQLMGRKDITFFLVTVTFSETIFEHVDVPDGYDPNSGKPRTKRELRSRRAQREEVRGIYAANRQEAWSLTAPIWKEKHVTGITVKERN